ncbi:antiviral reverse transcriptase Drt3b, partial [Candidatus Enterovibrio escicola]|uniref:antiviral reverse transcriptase Drt3b n=1 Tax=Candidatus Enterovibrio escicola TaxID=1927127 RepID=UPI0012380E7D
VDISKCFHHIYTHSISWAVKGKNFSKSYVNPDTFDGGFDKLMQLMNYNETNGIVIGPEISRVFAEIILQSIDSSVDAQLNSDKLVRGTNYEIRRYIDDYFIFTNDHDVADQIFKTLEKQLADFKLYVNESKTVSLSRPFITGETIAKIEIGKTIDHYFSQLVNFRKDNDYNEESLLNKIWNKSSLSNSFIRDIKSIVRKNDISFDAVISFSISILIKLLKKVLNAINNYKATVEPRELEKLKIFVLETSFFIFSMSPKSRSSYLICRLINLLKDDPEVSSDDSNINKAIFDEVTSLIQSNSSQNKEHNIELFNLICTSESLGKAFMLTDELVKQAFGIGENFEHLDYFQIICCIDYCANKRKLKSLKKQIINYVIETKFESISMIAKSTEAFLLLSDLLTCPYLSSAEKSSLANSYLKAFQKEDESLKDNKIGQKAALLISFFNSGNEWFYAWKTRPEDIRKLLLRKELRTAY